VVIWGYVPQGTGFYTLYKVSFIQWQQALVVYLSLGQLDSWLCCLSKVFTPSDAAGQSRSPEESYIIFMFKYLMFFFTFKSKYFKVNDIVEGSAWADSKLQLSTSMKVSWDFLFIACEVKCCVYCLYCRMLKPFIRRDYESRPLKMKLLEEIKTYPHRFVPHPL